MTLNIGLFAKHQIHVGADFRLTNADTRKIVSDSSPKVVLLRELYFTPDDWSAVITYTGIGRWKQRDTSEWLAEWITKLQSPRRFEDVIDCVKEEGTKWLRSVGFSCPHTFLIGSISSTKVKVALVSNIDRLHGPRRIELADQLEIEIADISAPRVITTGISNAISDENRRALESSIRRHAPVPEIQRNIASAIEAASETAESSGGIGKSSYTYSIDVSGAGAGYRHGEVTGPFTPIEIQNDQNMTALLQSIFGKNFQVVGGAFATSTQSAVSERECNPTLEFNADELSYELVELASMGAAHAKPKVRNAKGRIIGDLTKDSKTAPAATIWKGTKEVCPILGDRSRSSYGNDISDTDVVAGNHGCDNGANIAFILKNDVLTSLGTLGGKHSHANAVNLAEVVVGSSWTIPGDSPGDKRERAITWTADVGMREIGALRDDWLSRAEDINDRGQVVGVSFPPLPNFGVHAFFWSSETGMKALGALGTNGSSASSINSNGVVVGISGSESFIWDEVAGIRNCPMPLGSVVKSINDHGDMAYNRDTSRGLRPFVWLQGKGECALPVYRDHQGEALFVDNEQNVLGTITSGQHSHPVLWRLKK